MKRLYICSFADEEWVSGIVARSWKHARKLFFACSRFTYDDDIDGWIQIRCCLFDSEIDVSDLEFGEIDNKWGFDNHVYSDTLFDEERG